MCSEIPLLFSFSILIAILLNPVLCNCKSIQAVYMLCFVLVRSAGEVMAASLAQGGPCPNLIREWCFRYLCSGDSDSIQVSASDVTDFELSQLIERVNTSFKNINICINLIIIWLAQLLFWLLPLENNDTMQLNFT